ncbi:MAG: hypothetical protein AB1576_03830 [Bacillota bacterium]
MRSSSPLECDAYPLGPRTSCRVVLARPEPWTSVDAKNVPRPWEEAVQAGLLPSRGIAWGSESLG